MYEIHEHSDPDFPVIFHYDIYKQDSSFVSHWHESPEILYCICGKGEITADGERYFLNKGETFVVNSGCFHSIKCISEEALHYHCLIPSEELCDSFGFNIFETKYTPEIPNDMYLKEIFETIAKEYEKKQSYYKTKIKAEILNMFVYLSRNYTVTIPSGGISAAKKKMVKTAIRYIKNNCEKHMKIEDIAKITGFSRYYFCHSFKEMMGMSVINYINMLRCEKAKSYIYSGKYNISEIALMCGFENFSYFTKTYKKHMGMLPSEEFKSN